MAICVMAVVAVAPCQCFSPGGNQITSPGRISSMGPPHRWAQPQPAVTMRVWPRGCVCEAVRAPGSKVTLAPPTRPGAGASNSGSIRTVPVNQSAGPLPDGREPLRLMSICLLLRVGWAAAFAGVQIHLPLESSSSDLNLSGFGVDRVLDQFANRLQRMCLRSGNNIDRVPLVPDPQSAAAGGTIFCSLTGHGSSPA